MQGIKVTPPLSSVRKRIEKASKNVSDRTVVNKKISILLDQWVQLNFATQGKKVGGWPPFKYPEFGRHITGQGWDPSAKLLQDTGDLKKSHIPFSSKKVAGIGSDLPYSKPHHEGEGHLPQRRTIPDAKLDLSLMGQIRKMLDMHVEKAINV